MQIIAKCPTCKHDVKLESTAVDRRIRCPDCRTLFKIPNYTELKKTLDLLKNAKSTIYVDKDGRIYG